MELSKAPRLTPFTPWAESCAGISVLPGGQGTVAGGGGGGGGGGGTAHGPVGERDRRQVTHSSPPHAAATQPWVE